MSEPIYLRTAVEALDDPASIDNPKKITHKMAQDEEIEGVDEISSAK